MTTTDQWGCPLTADSAEIELIEQITADYVTMAPDIATKLPALAEGPPMARAFLSMLLTQSHRPAVVRQGRELAMGAKAEGHLVSARERAISMLLLPGRTGISTPPSTPWVRL